MSLSTRLAVHWPPLGNRPNSHHYGIQVHMIMPSKCISTLARLRPPSAFPTTLDYSLQGHIQTRSITDSKVRIIMAFQVLISTLAWSRPPSVSPTSLDYGLQVRTIMAPKFISTLARSRSQSASLSSLHRGLQVYLLIRSINVCKCIPKIDRSRTWSVSLNSLDRHFQVHHEFALKHRACSQSRYTV